MNDEALKAALDTDTHASGKFEGEDLATVYYYHCALDGDGDLLDINGDTFTVFNVEPDEAEQFGLTEPYFSLYESGSGFVSGEEISAQEFADMEAEAEAEDNE